jgi:branched-chain amino acid transport system substrate-binding protein
MAKKGAITKTQAIAILAIVIVAGVAGAGYYILTQPAPPPRDYILIGWVHALTGPLAPQTTTLHIYYRWIIEDYNSTGGLYVPEYGRKLPIRYIEYDDESDISKTITYTEKLITEDKVDLLFAPCSTAFCYAVMPLYEQYKIPVISLSFGSDIAGAKMKSGEWKYSFSVLGFPGESGNQTAQVFKYINSTLGNLKTVGIVYSADQHGVEYASAIASYLVYYGFNVTSQQSYPPYTIGYDFSPIVNNLQTSNPDVVIQCGYVECIFFALQCKIMGFCPKLYMHGPGMETPYLVHDIFGEGPGGSGGAGITTVAFLNACMYYDGWPATSYSSGALKDWAIAHHNRSSPYAPYPKMWPYPASATMYSALQCLFKAVEKVGLDHDKIKDSLATDSFETLLGTTKLRPGMSMQCELAGTLTQWCGGDMMDVIWPLSAASHSIIYPKPGWGA